MKSVFEKIKERLRTEKAELTTWAEDMAFELGIDKAIEIVNQVAEEYVEKTYKFGNSEQVINQSLTNNNQSLTNGGWIPCSERLPKVYEDSKSSDVVLVCGYDKESDYSWQAMGFYVHTEAIKRWFFAECKDTDKPIDWIDIVAWQPLPEPYRGE